MRNTAGRVLYLSGLLLFIPGNWFIDDQKFSWNSYFFLVSVGISLIIFGSTLMREKPKPYSAKYTCWCGFYVEASWTTEAGYLRGMDSLVKDMVEHEKTHKVNLKKDYR